LHYSGYVGNPITICHNAWIGLGVTMLGSVTMGEGPLIKSANAVLPKTYLLRSGSVSLMKFQTSALHWTAFDLNPAI
jgi:hypothetical protein